VGLLLITIILLFDFELNSGKMAARLIEMSKVKHLIRMYEFYPHRSSWKRKTLSLRACLVRQFGKNELPDHLGPILLDQVNNLVCWSLNIIAHPGEGWSTLPVFPPGVLPDLLIILTCFGNSIKKTSDKYFPCIVVLLIICKMFNIMPNCKLY